jgi:hypothetical protein
MMKMGEKKCQRFFYFRAWWVRGSKKTKIGMD